MMYETMVMGVYTMLFDMTTLIIQTYAFHYVFCSHKHKPIICYRVHEVNIIMNYNIDQRFLTLIRRLATTHAQVPRSIP